MSRIIRGLFLVALLALLLGRLTNNSYAQGTVGIEGPVPIPASTSGIIVPNQLKGDRIIYPGSAGINVGGRVGDLVVNISGLASPDSSVVLTDKNGDFMRSTVSDHQGFFTLSDVSIKKGFSGFCLESIDFKRIGDSEGCLNFSPIVKPRTFNDIYLPPTIGLFQKQISAGNQALIFGYSMPGADVQVKIRQGQIVNTTADSNGYYEYRYNNVPAGTYDLSSTGTYKNKKSLPPKKTAKLEALSVTQEITSKTAQTGKSVGTALTSTILGFLLLILLLIVIIVILILIIRHGGLTALLKKLKPHRHLHHDWLLAFIQHAVNH